MSSSVGIDICQIKRIKLDDEKLLMRILHVEELKVLNSISDAKRKMEFVAGRWAVKEAMFKVKNFNIGFDKVWVLSNGRPKVMEPKEFKNYDVSISHDGSFAIAIAVLNE